MSSLALLTGLPRLHSRQLAEKLTSAVQSQILAVLIVAEVVRASLLVPRVGERCTPSILIDGHARVDEISLVLVQVTARGLSVRVLKHAVVVAIILATELTVVELDGILSVLGP